MKIRLVKETDNFGRTSWFCQTDDKGLISFIPGSVCTTEADAIAKFEALAQHYGASTVQVILELDVPEPVRT
jgi:hypothetical protein